jgi:hypothetical protein
MNLAHDIATLPTLTVTQLRARYAEVFGETTNAPKPWLLKRIAWRLQALAEGDLSQRARQRAAELANDADLRLGPPPCPPLPTSDPGIAPASAGSIPVPRLADCRLPPPGGVLYRRYKGHQLQVTVLQAGFAYQGQVFPSLSAVARAITGSHCNGFLFFHLTQEAAQ